MKNLIRQNANILVIDNHWKTPLDHSFEIEDKSIFEYIQKTILKRLKTGIFNNDAVNLLAYNIRYFKDELKHNQNALQITELKGWFELRKILLRKQNIELKYLQISDDLINKQLNIIPSSQLDGDKETQPSHDYTLLMIAVKMGMFDEAKQLLAKGADYQTIASDGKTAFDLAVENDFEQIANYLELQYKKDFPKKRVVKKRKIAITDIHGHLTVFKNLIEEKIKLTKNDELYLLGDYIDRGEDSFGVIDYIVSLREQGYNVECLYGNHEIMFLQKIKRYSQEIAYKFLEFTKLFHYFLEVDNFVLVHAGFNLESNFAFTDKDSMLWTRRWENYDMLQKNIDLKDKYIIYGHTPHSKNFIINSIKYRKQFLPIDNAVFRRDKIKYGNLFAFDFANWEFYY